MRYKILAIAAIAAAISAPGATFAQTVGIVTDAPGITVEQRPAFRE